MKISLLFTIVCLVVFFCYAIFDRKIRTTANQTITRDFSICLKGILALLIVACHLGDACGNKIPLSGYLSSIGTPVVGVFFFLSGYGLLKSYRQKGRDYLSSFFSRRLSKIVLPFLVISFFSFIIDYINNDFNIDTYCIEMKKGYTPLPNSWFVYAIILFYLYFYICIKFFASHVKAIMGIFVLLLIQAFLMFESQWPKYWYESSFCSIVGMVFFLWETSIVHLMRRNFVRLFIALFFLLFSILYYACLLDVPEDYFSIIRFTAIIVIPITLGTIGLYIDSHKTLILKFLGTISYEIYLIHGLIIAILEDMCHNTMLFVALVFLVSLFSAYILHAMIQMINFHK